MSRITKVLTDLKEKGRKGLIVYLTASCPDYQTTLAAVEAIEKAGADIIEIGIPFSDPMADGPVIQKAATLALRSGATTAKTKQMIERIRDKSELPLVVMTYINTILNAGLEQFVQGFAASGIDGIIVPDMPVEESEVLDEVCRQAGVDLIHFVAPTTTQERIDIISKKAGGFVYCVSNTGVTGVRSVDYTEIGAVIEQVRKKTTVPTAIGFGIGSKKTACTAARHCDAVIIGSAVMQRLMDGGVDEAAGFIRDIRRALDEGE